MAKKPTNVQMAQKHEGWGTDLFDMDLTRGSGSQWHDPMDGRHRDGQWKFTLECKSTFHKSFPVTADLWRKAVEQSHGARPIVQIRLYEPDNHLLVPKLDVSLVDPYDLAEMISTLRALG